MFSHILGKSNSQKELLSGFLGILTFSFVNIAGIWQGCCELLPSSCSPPCKLLNAKLIGLGKQSFFQSPVNLL
jgi:hypothetical protein